MAIKSISFGSVCQKDSYLYADGEDDTTQIIYFRILSSINILICGSEVQCEK